jgi:hypothetical protein
LPLIWPAVASGWMLAFALSLDDLVLASFVTGPGATTLPIRIYSEVRLGVKPEINAVCTIMIAVVATGAGRGCRCSTSGGRRERGTRSGRGCNAVRPFFPSPARAGVEGKRAGPSGSRSEERHEGRII